MAVTFLLLGVELADESGLELTVRTFARGAQVVVTFCYNGPYSLFGSRITFHLPASLFVPNGCSSEFVRVLTPAQDRSGFCRCSLELQVFVGGCLSTENPLRVHVKNVVYCSRM